MFSSTAGKLVTSSTGAVGLSFPGALWMVANISWFTLDGCCYFLMHSGWLLLFPRALSMVAVIVAIILKKVFHGVGVTRGTASSMWRWGGVHKGKAWSVNLICIHPPPTFPFPPISPHFCPELSPAPPPP